MKLKMYHIVARLPRIGMRIPESWVKFEKVIHYWMVDKGIINHDCIDCIPVIILLQICIDIP